MAQRAGGSGIDQDAARSVFDEILIEQKAHTARPCSELGLGSGFDLLGRPAREVAIGHIRVPIRQGGSGKAAHLDLRERGDSGGGLSACGSHRKGLSTG